MRYHLQSLCIRQCFRHLITEMSTCQRKQNDCSYISAWKLFNDSMALPDTIDKI